MTAHWQGGQHVVVPPNRPWAVQGFCAIVDPLPSSELRKRHAIVSTSTPPSGSPSLAPGEAPHDSAHPPIDPPAPLSLYLSLSPA